MKADASKVPYHYGVAVLRAKDRKSVYSECVRLCFQSTGKFSCGFDNKDIQAWIDIYLPDTFDSKGNKKKENKDEE